MKIFKYALPIDDEFSVKLPRGARILSVQVQNDVPMLWALVDEAAMTVTRHFALRGTGHDADGLLALPFIATFQMHGGSLVFHLFERP